MEPLYVLGGAGHRHHLIPSSQQALELVDGGGAVFTGEASEALQQD